jgi:T-complex protein 1 subunit zeta
MASKAANLINPNAEIVSSSQCLQVNVSAARGLQMVLKSNLGPRGTLKMLVGGAGQIKITKDGNVLLHEMQIQHPTAMMIARAATAMDDQVGDGTTSSVLFTGELLKQAERHTSEGLHPRMICEGYEIAKDMCLEFLDAFRVPQPNIFNDRETLVNVVRTALRTKLAKEMADTMSENIASSVKAIAEPDIPIDLHMVEIMTIQNRMASDSRFVNGLVLDHGSRHPDMPKYIENVHVLTCNVSFEYESTEITAGFYYSSAEERERLVESERKFTDDKVRQVIEFKRRVCKEGESFCIINQKGIDPMSLDMFAKEGIVALRRAKRRNMERLTLACGGSPVNSVDDLEADMLGWTGKIYEEVLGDDKYTFVEDSRIGKACTLLIRGPNIHTLAQIKDAVRDGLRAAKCAIEDVCLVPGAGAFEVAASRMLKRRKTAVQGKARIGVEAFADSLLIIPKVLAENSGFDVQDSLIKVENEQELSEQPVGLNINTGNAFLGPAEGVWDSYIVKKQTLNLSTVLASQLLLVDEVMKAGKAMGKPKEYGDAMDEE